MKAIITALALSTLPGGATAAADDGAPSRPAALHAAALQADTLPTTRIERMVEERGFVEISGITRRSGLYLVEAVQPSGAVFRLALDARDGSLVASERLGWARASHEGHPPRKRAEFRFDF